MLPIGHSAKPSEVLSFGNPATNTVSGDGGIIRVAVLSKGNDPVARLTTVMQRRRWLPRPRIRNATDARVMMCLSVLCYVAPALFFGFLTYRGLSRLYDFPPGAKGIIDGLRNELPCAYMFALGIRDWRAAMRFTRQATIQEGIWWFAYGPVTCGIMLALTLIILIPLPA
jgi:hypothetical protein